MGDVVAVEFSEYPVACCPECDGTAWELPLNGFEQRWDKITGMKCLGCGFLVDWVSVELDRDTP